MEFFIDYDGLRWVITRAYRGNENQRNAGIAWAFSVQVGLTPKTKQKFHPIFSLNDLNIAVARSRGGNPYIGGQSRVDESGRRINAIAHYPGGRDDAKQAELQDGLIKALVPMLKKAHEAFAHRSDAPLEVNPQWAGLLELDTSEEEEGEDNPFDA
ncbi:MAG: hypothetical protein ACXABY_09210 [Candidatus Thorarchaeota archaeon]|jgi:hypothetical protein